MLQPSSRVQGGSRAYATAYICYSHPAGGRWQRKRMFARKWMTLLRLWTKEADRVMLLEVLPATPKHTHTHTPCCSPPAPLGPPASGIHPGAAPPGRSSSAGRRRSAHAPPHVAPDASMRCSRTGRQPGRRVKGGRRRVGQHVVPHPHNIFCYAFMAA